MFLKAFHKQEQNLTKDCFSLDTEKKVLNALEGFF